MEHYAGIDVSLELSSVCVVDPETRHVKAALSAMTVKTDRKDARGLAQLIRMGWYRPVRANRWARRRCERCCAYSASSVLCSLPSSLIEDTYLIRRTNCWLGRRGDE